MKPPRTAFLRRRRAGTGLLRQALILPVLLLALTPAPLLACATCFGKSDSQMAKGMNAGIFTLLCCILSVLAAISVFFFYIMRRAARLAATAPSIPDPRSLSSPTHS